MRPTNSPLCLSHHKWTPCTVYVIEGECVPWQRRSSAPSPSASPLLRRQIFTKKPQSWARQSFINKSDWPCWSSGLQQVSSRSLCQVPGGLLFYCFHWRFLVLDWLLAAWLSHSATFAPTPPFFTSVWIRSCLAPSQGLLLLPRHSKNPVWARGRDWGALDCG